MSHPAGLTGSEWSSSPAVLGRETWAIQRKNAPRKSAIGGSRLKGRVGVNTTVALGDAPRNNSTSKPRSPRRPVAAASPGPRHQPCPVSSNRYIFGVWGLGGRGLSVARHGPLRASTRYIVESDTGAAATSSMPNRLGARFSQPDDPGLNRRDRQARYKSTTWRGHCGTKTGARIEHRRSEATLSGGSGIRTHGGRKTTHALQACRIVRSRIPPGHPRAGAQKVAQG